MAIDDDRIRVLFRRPHLGDAVKDVLAPHEQRRVDRVADDVRVVKGGRRALPGAGGSLHDAGRAASRRRHLLQRRFAQPPLLGCDDRLPELDGAVQQHALRLWSFSSHVAGQLVECARSAVEGSRLLARVRGAHKGRNLPAHVPQRLQGFDDPGTHQPIAQLVAPGHRLVGRGQALHGADLKVAVDGRKSAGDLHAVLQGAHTFVGRLEPLGQVYLLRDRGLQLGFCSQQFVQERAELREWGRVHPPPAAGEAPDQVFRVLGRLAGGGQVALPKLAHQHQAGRAVASVLETARGRHQVLVQHGKMGQVIHQRQGVWPATHIVRQDPLHGAALESTHGDPERHAQATVQIPVQAALQWGIQARQGPHGQFVPQGGVA